MQGQHATRIRDVFVMPESSDFTKASSGTPINMPWWSSKKAAYHVEVIASQLTIVIATIFNW